MPLGNANASSQAQLAAEWRIGTYEWWPEADRLVWSEDLLRLYGLTDAPATQGGFIARVHPEDRADVEGETSACLGTDARGYSRRFRILRPDGAVRVMLDRAAIERDGKGNARVIRGMNIDVTDEALSGPGRIGAGPPRARETQLYLAMQAALAIAFEWDIRGNRVWRILSDDPALPRTADEPGSFEQVVQAVHPDDRAAFQEAVSAALSSPDGKYYSEHRVIGPGGAGRWIAEKGEVEFDRDGDPVRLVGISHDISRRKQAEEEVEKAKALLEALFDSAPVGLAVWDSDFRFLRINRELAAINGLPPEAHIGRRPDEILPRVDGLDEVYRNWTRLLETGEPWRGVEITGETPAQPGRLRSWVEDFFPVRVGDRNVGIAAIVQESSLRKAAEQEARASEKRYRTLFEAIDDGFCVLEVSFGAADGRIDYCVVEANDAFYEQTGLDGSVIGRSMRDLMPDADEHWFEIYGDVARTGGPMRLEQKSHMLDRWFEVYTFGMDGPRSSHVAVLFRDITARKRQEEQTDLLLREVNHRSKNMLGLVQAIARHTATPGAEEFVARFAERVQALAVAQDLLISNSWETVPVEDLVRSQLAHVSDLIGKRIEIDGPALFVKPTAVQALGMALHELTTNAAKYGALSNSAGRISITWEIGNDGAAEQQFTLCWQERGGPPASAPAARGFGSRVIGEMVEASTGGKVFIAYAHAGLSWRLSCPAAGVLAGTGLPPDPAAPAAVSATHAATPDRTRILVVEDEALIAAEMADLLTGEGFAVLGPARNVAEALALIERHGCDAALLDMNLGHETAEPVAQRLGCEAIPFVLVSGYSREQLPLAVRDAPLAAKPVRAETVLTLLRNALSAGEAPGH